jgi:hypothetical protein
MKNERGHLQCIFRYLQEEGYTVTVVIVLVLVFRHALKKKHLHVLLLESDVHFEFSSTKISRFYDMITIS